MSRPGPLPRPSVWLESPFVVALRAYSDLHRATQRDLGLIVGFTQSKVSAAVRGLPFPSTPLNRGRWETLARLVGYAGPILSAAPTGASWKVR